MALFQRRHYNWLTRWAGENISLKAAQSLAVDLAADNPRFQQDRFIDAYKAQAAYVAADNEAARRARAGVPMPVPVDLDKFI